MIRARGAPHLTPPDADVAALPAPGPGLFAFRVVPHPRARQVKLELDGAPVRTLEVGPKASAIAIRLSGTAPVKNRDTATELTVEVLGEDGKADPDSAPPVLRCNVGSITQLERVAPGRYKANYALPTTRYPEVAEVVAFSAWPHPQSVHGSFGVLRVPLASAVDLPGETEREAEFSIKIAGQNFGPVKAGQDGKFKVPVVVPPGYGTGTGTAVDRVGNRRSFPVDLQLPPTDQLACVVSPPRLPADGTSHARILCATSDPFGNVVTGAKVQLAVAFGTLSAPRNAENGVTEWTYTPPRRVPEKPELLKATWKIGKQTSHEEMSIELAQGPARTLQVTMDDHVVHRGATGLAHLSVFDPMGRPRAGAHLEVTGVTAPKVTEPKPGQLEVRFSVPDREPPLDAEVTVWGPEGNEPARILTWSESGSLFAAVTDLAGLPVPHQTLKLGDRSLVTGDSGIVAVQALGDGDLTLIHGQWPGLRTTVHLRDGGKTLFPSGESPQSAKVPLELVVAPSVPVNVRIEVQGAQVRYWAESADGEHLTGRVLEAHLSLGTLKESVEDAQGVHQVDVAGLPAGPASLTVRDQQSGVIALAWVKR